jgi:UDP-glucose 4-epimerase
VDYLSKQSGYRVWNLGTGRGYSVLEVICGLEQVIGRPLPWRIAMRRPGDTAQCWADPARAAADLGWRARRGLHDMLADHWRWQEQNPEGYRQ